MDSSKTRSQRWAAHGLDPGFYHTQGIPRLCEQPSTSRLKGLSKTTEASFMVDVYGPGFENGLSGTYRRNPAYTSS